MYPLTPGFPRFGSYAPPGMGTPPRFILFFMAVISFNKKRIDFS
jgi:hypothetical protein